MRRPVNGGLRRLAGPAACVLLGAAGLTGCRDRVDTVALPAHLPPYLVGAGELSHDPLSLVLGPGRNPADPRLAARDRAVLARYLATLARTGPASAPELFASRRDRLAFLVNAHVAWTLALHDEGGLAPANQRDTRRTRFPLDGSETCLADLEADLVAAAERQPRLVLCLNPGLPGPPPLPAAALTGHALDWQLRDHALRAGRTPGFWLLDESPPRLRVTAFTDFLPGLAAQRPARMRQLLALVPPPVALEAAIHRVCGETLSRCALDLVPLPVGAE